MRRTIELAALLLAAAGPAAGDAAAQQPRFYYPAPPTAAVRVTRGVRFATVDTLHLAMDVYRPAARSAKSPALVFYSQYWPSEGRPARESNDWLVSWARIAAAQGIVGIIPDIRAEPGTGNATTPARALGDDFQRMIAFLAAHASEYGVDPNRIAVMASSGSVSAAFPAVEDPRQTAIKAAVMYYGSADVTSFRRDLPLLYVRAGMDSPSMNAAIDRLASLAVAQNAPITLLNHHSGQHGFEGRDDNAATREVIEQTLQFVKRATAPAYQAAIRAGQLDAAAAAHLSTGNFHEASLVFAELLKQRPADRQLRLSYGQALLADEQYDAACAELRRMTPPGEGSFQSILPGTRACVLAGALDTAVVWLQGMPKAWVQSPYVGGLRADSVFAPLWGRADFQALFRP
ncbi:MAG TPA: hypothetical protein VKA84_10610 [Gemmatimonadaceae bacterium]|nr:hypothetical protein [Gemmatimonadaceae bacterium]